MIDMDTNKRALLIQVIKQWHTYTQDELDLLSDMEVSVIGGYTMQAVQVAHGKTRSFSCWTITLIPVIIAVTVILTYCVK